MRLGSGGLNEHAKLFDAALQKPPVQRIERVADAPKCEIVLPLIKVKPQACISSWFSALAKAILPLSRTIAFDL
jgi:hypothetical protein